MSRVLRNIEEYGNTSAGSIPLALQQAVKEGKVKKGDALIYRCPFNFLVHIICTTNQTSYCDYYDEPVGDIIAMAGFGAGLSWGAAIIRWG